jgi:hypothetical protein
MQCSNRGEEREGEREARERERKGGRERESRAAPNLRLYTTSTKIQRILLKWTSSRISTCN